MRALAPWLVALTCLGGCVPLIGDVPARQWYTLEDPVPQDRVPGAPIERSVLIEASSAGAFHDATALTYSRQSGVRAHYHFAGWAERPSRRIARLLERRLADRGRFASVAQSTAGVRGDLLLRLTLDDAYHDLSVRPGASRIMLTAELIDWRARALIGRRQFAFAAPVNSEDAAAGAQGLQRAVIELLDQVAPWTEELAATAPAR